ncbi:hypothetical protein [Mechercharimyces sp. CAU 1602]|nr:hypothetical protein [Mechercharimyces sp. CAU 1602]MCS1350739.1 hypothetical protein [Mechercharimyces sp. CAU 1602]
MKQKREAKGYTTTCPHCGKQIAKESETKLNDCCSQYWIKQQLDNCYW